MTIIEEPKRPKNSYFMWLSENREALINEAGTGAAVVISKFASQKWRAVQDAEKAVFENKAKEAKEAYAKQLDGVHY